VCRNNPSAGLQLNFALLIAILKNNDLAQGVLRARIIDMGTTVAIPREGVSGVSVGPPPIQHAVPVRLSEILWGIDWNLVFPFEIKPGIWVEVSSPDTVTEFSVKNFASIFGDLSSAGFWPDNSPAKQRYLQHACDAFMVRDGDDPIGIVICDPTDWTTYYLRMAAFLPAYQGQDLIKLIAHRLCGVLAGAGVVRFECDAAPSNTRTIGAALSFGFVVTGTSLSERWGALTRLTRYLDAGAEEAYLDRYCAAGRVHRDGRQRRPSTAPANRGH
jgi:Acetyltransferase (GNAT) family